MKKVKYCFIFTILAAIFLSSCQSDIQMISFESYPDGSPVVLEKIDDSGGPFQPVQGDIYDDWGFNVQSYPIEDCLAIISTRFDSVDFYLGLNTMSDCGDAARLEVEFIEPVKSVDIAFIGVATTYRMDAIDSAGEVIDSSFVMCTGKYDGPLAHLIYTSNTADIKKISIGTKIEMPLPIINIKELHFER